MLEEEVSGEFPEMFSACETNLRAHQHAQRPRVTLFSLWRVSAAASRRLRKVVPAVGVSMSVYYLLHISFMWFVKFDYGYNMKVLQGRCRGPLSEAE